ncbi:MAG: PaREP1 family protein [Thermoprotei archaeon]
MEDLIRRAQEKGIDVEELILLALSREDPQEAAELRMELAEKYFSEAEDYLRRGDAVQASEKAYKAAEEAVKALAEKFDVPEYKQALREGRWYAYLLGKASSSLAKELGEWAVYGWSSAYFLHVWGFHEGKLNPDDVTAYLNRVKEMLRKAKEVIEQKKG